MSALTGSIAATRRLNHGRVDSRGTVPSVTSLFDASSSYNFLSRRIKKGLIPAPGVRAKVGALNAKKEQNNKAS